MKHQILKIKDSATFGGSSSSSHWWLKCKSSKGKIYYREMTHLYNPDYKRFNQLHRGLLEKYHVSSFETPSGISKTRKYFHYSRGDVESSRFVSIRKIK